MGKITPVAGVSLNKSATTIYTGNTETLTASVAPATATNKAVTWSSSNPAVASVDAAGTVTALAPGMAAITVSTADGAKVASCAVTVTKDPVANAIAIVDDCLLMAYPNPTDGIVTVTGLAPGAIVRIFSIAGTQVTTLTAEAETIVIDLSSLAAGMYFLNVDGRTLRVIRK